jgi:hypothetical protein
MSKITPLAYAIHRDDESPIFGESTLHVCAEDEGAGLFFCIKTLDSTAQAGEVKLDAADLADVVAAAEMLRAAHGGQA